MPDVQPKPDLADVPMQPAPTAEQVDRDEEPTGTNPADPEDLTLPTE